MKSRSTNSNVLALVLAIILPVIAFAQPANDDCAGAIELFPASGCAPTFGDVTNATQSIPAVSCTGINGTADDDVWYRFTATFASHRIEVQGSAGFNAVIELRSGPCNGATIRCTDLAPTGVAEWLTPTGLGVGTEYYIRVYTRDAVAPSTTTFTICVRDPVVPVNNDCAGAINLVPNPTCAPTMASVANATQSLPAIDCNGVGNANDDVWFSFTATETDHVIELTLPSGFFPVIDLRSGACNGTNIACNDDVTLAATGLTIGETYYFRVYHIFGGIPSNTSFTVCVIGAAPVVCDADAGTITADATPVCLVSGSATIGATLDGNAVVPTGFATLYLMAQGAGQLIVDTDASPSFIAAAADDYVIQTLIYDPNTFDPVTDIIIGSTTTADVNAALLQGGGTICGSLDVTGAAITVEICATCDADAGTITADATPVCLVAGSATISATPDGNAVVPIGYTTLYLLSQGAGQLIIATDAASSFTATAADTYAIHTLVYDPNTFDPGTAITTGSTTVPEVEAVLVQGGGLICASLDITGAGIVVDVCVICDADAGTITPDETPVCLVGGVATFTATPDANAVVPVGFQTTYLLVESVGSTIVAYDAAPGFTVNTAGTYTIHGFVYDPATFDPAIDITLSTTTTGDLNALLLQGGGTICGGLDLVGATLVVENCVVCDADAGTITADATPVCLVSGNADISATPDFNSIVPSGFFSAYVLTQGASFIIVNASATPNFTVNVADDYTIHTLVYDPNTFDLGSVVIGVTTAFDVDAMLIQGGGTICGSLDLTGAAITVEECVTCDAVAGTITADATPVCLVGGSANITATPDGNAVVPTGYETLFVLTEGAGLTIVATSNVPDFSVLTAGSYIVHTLVYDPATLDLSGVTDAFQVDALLIQGGGTICGSLDLVGAPITVQECITCDANAGALIADLTPVCLVGGSADLSATADGGAVVPAGYETVYVLSQGAGLVLIATAATPSFNVTATDSYTIHTLVYDPNTLDLGSIVLGTTTGFDVNALLIQGGGSICGSLDVTGALFEVIDCVVCDADAGTLTADATPVCLLSGAAQIGATPNGDAVEPDGYLTAYVLTQGPTLVIIELGGGPVFNVNAPGAYTIHTIIYDPLTVDPGLIELGVTTGFDIDALLIQGGGSICGSLDMAGAPIIVNDCAPGNNDCVNAFPLAVNVVNNCPDQATAGDNTYATMDGGDAGCDDPGADLLDVWYTFNSGANTTVTINFNSGSMEDWALSIATGCAGSELLCLTQPVDPIVFATDPDTDYIVRIHSNLANGNGGQFTLCITGDVPTVICDGGSVQTVDGFFNVDVCQDAVPDVIDFATTSTAAENYTFLLTDDNNIIVAQLMGGSLDFNSAALGIYHVWGLSYNGDLVGADPGLLATEIATTGSCLDFSDNFVQVNVEICDGLVDGSTAAWNLFPNPNTGDFTLTYVGPDAVTTLEVLDMEGRTVHQQRSNMTKGQAVGVELKGQLAMGVYTVRLSNAAGNTNMRMVVR